MRIKTVALLFASLFLLLTGCSGSNTWSFTMHGQGEHWEGIMEIKPDANQSESVLFIGKIRSISVKGITALHYEAYINNSNPGGNLKGIDLEKLKQGDLVELFSDVPSTSYDVVTRDMSEQEVQNTLRNVSFTISWTDQTGDHSEEIKLDIIEKQ